MAKSKERQQAISLRKSGKSIKEIAKLLSVSVGSVSVWCRGISLNPAQVEILQLRLKDPNYGKRAEYLDRIKKETQTRIEKLKLEGLQELGTLSRRDVYIAGLALYWAEGFKKDHQIGFSNLNPYMIQFFISWLTVCLKIKMTDIKLRVVLNQHYIHQATEIEKYWSKFLRIPLSQFQKPTITKSKWKKDYENKSDYKGVLRVRVAMSLSLLRKILGSIEGFYYTDIH
jgi:hypothetical protein